MSTATIESKVTNGAKNDYKKLLKKYNEQQKILKALKNDEKLGLREKFKNLSAGRKKKYTPVQLRNRIIDYFAHVQATNKPPSVSGLMVHLKMHRDQFYTYAGYPEYKDIMEQTRNMIENWFEESMSMGRCSIPAAQFVLKNRFGWTDTQTVKHENVIEEGQLIARITALAPELASIFTSNKPLLIESSPTLEAEVVEDEESATFNKVVSLFKEEV